MNLKDHSDYVGRIDPSSRSACRIDCSICDLVIPDDAPAFVYFDITVSDFCVLCERCHQS